MITAILTPKLTLAVFLSIHNFCTSFIAEEPDCTNDVVQCYLDDAYTVDECKTEFLTNKYGAYDGKMDEI